MEQLLGSIIMFVKETVVNSSIPIGITVGMLIIILESMIPLLPLALFIAINVLVFGNMLGFFISWIATVIGCSIAFFLFKNGFKKLKKKQNLSIIITKLNTINFSKLVLIMAFPFTPAFLINIGAGLSEISYRKFLLALLISKAIIVYFWGFIGTSFMDCFEHPIVIFKIVILLLGAFILSKITINRLQIE